MRKTNPIRQSQPCETKPISGGARWHEARGRAGGGHFCETNPISARRATGPGAWEEQTCKTKPISRFRIADWGRTALRPTPSVVWRAKRAKQTQMWAGWDIWGMARWRGGQSCETKPVSARRQVGGASRDRKREGVRLGARSTLRMVQLRQTNPIPPGRRADRGPGRAKRAERTRFRPSRAQSFHCSIIPLFQSPANRAKRSQFGRPVRPSRWTWNPPPSAGHARQADNGRCALTDGARVSTMAGIIAGVLGRSKHES